MGRAARRWQHRRCNAIECPMPRPKDDLSKSLVALDQHRTLIAVIELSLKNWLVGGIAPGVEREPLKKLVPDAEAVLRLLPRCRHDPAKPHRTTPRISATFDADTTPSS